MAGAGELIALVITFIAGAFLLADLAGVFDQPETTSIDLDGRQRRWAERQEELEP